MHTQIDGALLHRVTDARVKHARATECIMLGRNACGRQTNANISDVRGATIKCGRLHASVLMHPGSMLRRPMA